MTWTTCELKWFYADTVFFFFFCLKTILTSMVRVPVVSLNKDIERGDERVEEVLRHAERRVNAQFALRLD